MTSIRLNCLVYIVAIAAVMLTIVNAVPLDREDATHGSLMRRARVHSSGNTGNTGSRGAAASSKQGQNASGGSTSKSKIPACGGKAKRGDTPAACVEEPPLEEDDLEEDPTPAEEAYVPPGLTDKDVESPANSEDYNPVDLAVTARKKPKRSLWKRNPVAIRAIKGLKSTLTYAQEYISQPLSKQIVFYMRKGANGIPALVKSTMDKAKDPGEVQVEHVLEIQRVISIFKVPKPTDVSEGAWKTMEVAVADDTNSDDSPAKEAIGQILNAKSNHRLLAKRVNLLKGIVCGLTDNPINSKGGSNVGPKYATVWARSDVQGARDYTGKGTRKQYTTTGNTLAKVLSEITGDKNLESYIVAELKRRLEKDIAHYDAALKLPVAEGKSFKVEDMQGSKSTTTGGSKKP